MTREQAFGAVARDAIAHPGHRYLVRRLPDGSWVAVRRD